MQTKLHVNFDHLSDADFLEKSRLIIVSLTGNPHYPEPWVPTMPSLEWLYSALNSYRDAHYASLSQNPQDIKQRKTHRQVLMYLFGWLAPYLENVAKGDSEILASTGYDLQHSEGSINIPVHKDEHGYNGYQNDILTSYAAQQHYAATHHSTRSIHSSSATDSYCKSSQMQWVLASC
jgi:hypothetical protein